MKRYIFQVEVQASTDLDALYFLGRGEHQWNGFRLDLVLDDDGEKIWEAPKFYGVA